MAEEKTCLTDEERAEVKKKHDENAADKKDMIPLVGGLFGINKIKKGNETAKLLILPPCESKDVSLGETGSMASPPTPAPENKGLDKLLPDGMTFSSSDKTAPRGK